MNKVFQRKWRGFRRSEDGSMSSIELLFWFPFFMYMTYSGIDLGLMSFNHSNLERALDETVREVRLNRLPAGEAEWTHELLKEMICERARHIPDCSENLALEMKSIDPRIGNTLADELFCVDRAEEIKKDREQVFVPGASNELMILRACLEVTPVHGFTTVGHLADQRPNGQWEVEAITVFVHEPFGGGSTVHTPTTSAGG